MKQLEQSAKKNGFDGVITRGEVQYLFKARKGVAEGS
jgi:hypothetical protein